MLQTTREALIDIVSSGMNTDNLICIQDGMYWSLDRGNIVICTASEDSEVITLTLAAYKLDFTLEALIRSFNENSSSYKIKVEDYSKYDDSENVGVGLHRLRTDIISGFTPDIYALYGLPAEVYASKGILEDLTPYFSEKAEIQMSDFLPNVLDALSLNDALYYITPSFSIFTVCGDQSFVGNKGAWTPEDFFSAVQSIDPVKIFGPEMIQERFMFYVMLFNGDEYVDKEQAECHFIDSNFKQFLEFAAQLPSSLSEESHFSNDWGRNYSGEQKLLCDWFGAGAISMVSYADTVFSGSAQFVGFPSSSSGTALVPSTLVGMSASSQQKDGVIDFIYFILHDAYQLDQTCISDFPVTQKAFERKMNSWITMYEEYLPVLYAYNDGSIIEIEAKTPPEDAWSCVNNLVNKATILSLQDEALFEIVIEEASAYFAGIISSKQATERIQSKANIYISEQFG